MELLIGVLGIAVAVGTYALGKRHGQRVREEDRRENRIQRLADDYVDKHDRNIRSGVGQLIPSGVVELKSDSEIRDALERCARRTGKHPLGKNSSLLEDVDLKAFFEFVARNGIDFSRTSVAEAIDRMLRSE